jgi:hypothetical protein
VDQEKVRDLVHHLLARSRHGLLKTQLVKFLYLIDLEWVKATGEPLTGLSWRFHHHGPWDGEIDRLLGRMNDDGEISAENGTNAYGHLYTVFHSSRRASGIHLTTAERMVADHILAAFEKFPLSDLLSDVVYETEPMKQAHRGEALDLRLVGRYHDDLSFVADGFWGTED